MAAAAKLFRVHVGDAIRVGSGAVARNFGSGVAPRAAACSADSKMTIADPSPITNPPRVRLKGRLAAVGSSFAVESAVNRLNPVTPSSCNSVRATGQHEIGFAAANQMGRLTDGLGSSPQAVRQLEVGPRKSYSKAKWRAGAKGSCSASNSREYAHARFCPR